MTDDDAIVPGGLGQAQETMVAARFDGAAMLTGPSGSGKSVALLRRAVRLLDEDPSARVALATMTGRHARRLEGAFAQLAAGRPGFASRMTIGSWQELAEELHGYVGGRVPVMAPPDLIRDQAASALLDGGHAFELDRMMAEWDQVVDAWMITAEGGYLSAPNPDGMPPLSVSERIALWPYIRRVRHVLDARMQMSPGELFSRMADYYRDKADKPFDHVLVDEAQDLSFIEACFFAALAPDRPDGLLLAAEESMRTVRPWIGWEEAGIDLGGRLERLEDASRMPETVRAFCGALLAGRASRQWQGRDGPLAFAAGEAIPGSLVSFAAARDGLEGRTSAIVWLTPEGRTCAHEAVTLAGIDVVGEPAKGRVAVLGVNDAKGLGFDAVAVTGFHRSLLDSEEGPADARAALARRRAHLACSRTRDTLLVCLQG
ncbi:MAG: AAA family ATPase [Zhengella sp.]|uniref:AAA family ATPase n=1 Tax=Zhengella sp. TaxID=2282762 RepID=UPI001DC058D1|nr:AAA family ATPase [Notoacmeibacter sp.]MCC0026690.1 AAA family ATPase [Brucellaceae bacterium]